MATDAAHAARRPAGCADDPKPDLLALVHRHTRAVIDAELHRLARRAPSLSPADLDVIDTALEGLAESVILAPLRNARWDTAILLARLFGAGVNADGKRTDTAGSRRAASSAAQAQAGRRPV